MHRYSIDQLIGWFKDGVIWWVLSFTQLRNLVTVPQQPPSWWYLWFSWGDWYYGSDNDYHPYPQLAERFMVGVWRLLELFIGESASAVTNAASTFLRALIGALPSWASSVSSWVNNLTARLGDGALLWASNTIQAVQRLYEWLPVEVKIAGMSWSSLFDGVKASVKSWVTTTYSETVTRAANAIGWVSGAGNTLTTWYNAVGSWVADLRSNFTSRVASSLGDAWGWLVSFRSNPKSIIDALYGSGLATAITLAVNAGPWLYNLWSNYHADVSAFLASPGDWILKRVSDEVERLW